jgi:hypothetical protein
MPSGRLGKAALAASQDTAIYTAPAAPVATVATATISFCNRGPGDALVRLAVSVGAAPIVDDYIEYDATLQAGGVLERTGVVCSPGEKIIVRSSTGNVSVRAHGFEEAA